LAGTGKPTAWLTLDQPMSETPFLFIGSNTRLGRGSLSMSFHEIQVFTQPQSKTNRQQSPLGSDIGDK
jgi:hypothetical protein